MHYSPATDKSGTARVTGSDGGQAGAARSLWAARAVPRHCDPPSGGRPGTAAAGGTARQSARRPARWSGRRDRRPRRAARCGVPPANWRTAGAPESSRPGIHWTAGEFIDGIPALGAEQLGERQIVRGQEVNDQVAGPQRHRVGVVGLGQQYALPLRLDAGLDVELDRQPARSRSSAVVTTISGRPPSSRRPLWKHAGQVICWTPGWSVRWPSASSSSAADAAVSRRRRSMTALSDQRKSCSRILTARSLGYRAIAYGGKIATPTPAITNAAEETRRLQSRPHAPRSRPVEHQPQVPLRKHPGLAHRRNAERLRY